MSFLSETIARYRANRELRKAAPLLKKFAEEAPSSFLKDLLYNSDGTSVDSIEARNTLIQAADRVLKETKWI